MSAYIAILSARLRTLLQYRAVALAGIITQLFWGLIRIAIFEAFYRSSTDVQPMTYSEVADYIWLGQAMFALIPVTADSDLHTMIRTGTVAYELLRPVDLYNFWYSRSLASRIAPALLRSLPVFGVALLFFSLKPPASYASAAAWSLAIISALLLSSAISTLSSILLLWTISGEGINRLLTLLVFVFSGTLIPLPLFPEWFQPFLNFLPFRGLVDVPLRLYMGHIPASDAWMMLGHQLIWILLFVALGRCLLAYGTHRLVVQGG